MADAPDQLTWAIVWSHGLRAELTTIRPARSGGGATVAYTHRTTAGALREARLTTLA